MRSNSLSYSKATVARSRVHNHSARRSCQSFLGIFISSHNYKLDSISDIILTHFKYVMHVYASC